MDSPLFTETTLTLPSCLIIGITTSFYIIKPLTSYKGFINWFNSVIPSQQVQ